MVVGSARSQARAEPRALFFLGGFAGLRATFGLLRGLLRGRGRGLGLGHGLGLGPGGSGLSSLRKEPHPEAARRLGALLSGRRRSLRRLSPTS